MIRMTHPVTPKEYMKIRANTWNTFSNPKPRAISINGTRLRVRFLEVLGVYYHRGPRLLLYINGESANL